MEYSGKILCVTHAELTAVMTEQNVKNLRHRGQIQQVRRACTGYPALFAVDSLPEKYRKQVLSMYQMPDKEIQSTFAIVPDCEATRYYSTYTLDDGRHLPEAKREELANNAAILNALGRMLEQSDTLNHRLGRKAISRTDFWQRAAAHLITIATRHTLPRNARMLQRKYNAYIAGGYAALIGNQWGNGNALKVKDDLASSTLTQLLAISNNLSNAQIAAAYNQYAIANGWKTITEGAVSQWRYKTELTTSAARRGTSNFYNEKAMTVKRSRPSAPLLMWSLDGWDCELLYQDTRNGRTTYYNRVVLEVVLDPVNDYIIGYAIGEAENAALITKAIKNALHHTQQLFGSMHRVCQIQSDHFAMSAMQPVYAAVADKVTPARVGNAKAKPIERFFNYLNRTYCQMCSNWSGFGVTTDPTRQPNSEALNLRKKDFPDLQGLIQQIDGIIAADRAKKQAEYIRLYDNLADDRRLAMPRADYLYYFGETTGRTNRLTASGLTPTILGAKRDYDCFDIKFRELAFTDWTVKYDPDDLSTVIAVSADGAQRFVLEEKYVQPMALADRKDGDAEQLQRVRDFNRELHDHVVDTLAETADNVGRIVRFPKSVDVLSRLMLTDSTGDHKTNRRRAALKAASPDPPPDPDYDMF